MTGHFFIYNNKLFPEGTPVISAGNRSLRYGDGLFETMKMLSGRIINKAYHFERLFHGMQVLEFDVPKKMDKGFFEKKIGELLVKNNHSNAVRIRLMVFREDGSIFNTSHSLGYIIETFEIDDSSIKNNGLIVDVFPGAKKSVDVFSNLKSNNYLPYAMAGIYAQKNKLNECIILNAHGRVCESIIGNVFIVKNKKVLTPPLSEGCVAGTFRRFLLENGAFEKYSFREKKLTPNDVLDAEEIFLTNAISYIRWVKKFMNKSYPNKAIQQLYNTITETI